MTRGGSADARPRFGAATPPGRRQRTCGGFVGGCWKLAGMSAWQYAQLTIRLEGRGAEDSCTILWHGPGQGVGESFSGSGQTVLELMNRAGADGWELAGLEERREGGDGRAYWDAAWSLTTYTFKRLVPPKASAACSPGHRPAGPSRAL